MCRTGLRHCRGNWTTTRRSLENAQRRVTRNTAKAVAARAAGDETKATAYETLADTATAEVTRLRATLDHSPASTTPETAPDCPVEVYDASGDLCEVTPGMIDDEADWVYKNGQCLALAVAASMRTGWPVHLRTFTDGDPADPTGTYLNLRHAYLQAPDGALIDIRGEHDADIVDEEARDFDGDLYAPPRIVPAAQSRALLAEFEGYLYDQDLDTAHTFVAPMLEQAGFDTTDLPDHDGTAGPSETGSAQRRARARITDDIVAQYTQGDCYLLAHALAEHNNWGVLVVGDVHEDDDWWNDDPENPTYEVENLFHVWAVRPDGRLVDVRGVHSPEVADRLAETWGSTKHQYPNATEATRVWDVGQWGADEEQEFAAEVAGWVTDAYAED